MLVKEIMTSNVKTITPDTRIAEVVSLMCLYRYSGLPVVQDDKLVGFVAEKDVLSRLFPSVEDTMQNMASIDFNEMINTYGSLLNKSVSELMVKGVKSVTPDLPILKAAVIMAGNRFRRIPVAEGDRLVGMLSLGDVHKAIFHRSLIQSHKVA